MGSLACGPLEGSLLGGGVGVGEKEDGVDVPVTTKC